MHLKGTRPPSGIATRLAGLCASLVPYLENPLLLHLRFINGVDLCLAVRAAPSPRGVRGWVGGLIESLTSCCACRVFGCAHQSIKESIWSYRSFVAVFLIITSIIHTPTQIITYMCSHIHSHMHTMIFIVCSCPIRLLLMTVWLAIWTR